MQEDYPKDENGTPLPKPEHPISSLDDLMLSRDEREETIKFILKKHPGTPSTLIRMIINQVMDILAIPNVSSKTAPQNKISAMRLLAEVMGLLSTTDAGTKGLQKFKFEIEGIKGKRRKATSSE